MEDTRQELAIIDSLTDEKFINARNKGLKEIEDLITFEIGTKILEKGFNLDKTWKYEEGLSVKGNRPVGFVKCPGCPQKIELKVKKDGKSFDFNLAIDHAIVHILMLRKAAKNKVSRKCDGI